MSSDVEATTEVTQEEQGGGMVPKTRLDEVIAQRNAYEAKLQQLQEQYEQDLTTFKTQVDELAPFKEQATASRLEAMRMRVAAEQGLPVALAERLKGNDLDELLADAQAIKSILPTPAPATGNPPPAPRAPTGPAVTSAQLQDASWVRQNPDKVQAYYNSLTQ